MKSSEVVLRAVGLERRVPGRTEPLLHSVSLHIGAGERLAILGPSGSGKTLLLRALALLDPLSAGQIQWQGEPVGREQIPRFRSQVIYHHQRPALIEGTVEDNMQLPFSLAVHRGRTYDRQVVEEWLAHLQRPTSFLQKRVRDLSGGEQQVTALLRSMQLDPQLMLLDEPTAALDAEASVAVERLIQNWRAQCPASRSFVLVSHDLAQADRMADRRITVADGRIMEGS